MRNAFPSREGQVCKRERSRPDGRKFFRAANWLQVAKENNKEQKQKRKQES